MWCGNAIQKICKKWLTRARELPNISVTHSQLMQAWFIIRGSMPCRKERRTPIRLRVTMPNCVTIWPGWQENLVVFRAVHMPCVVHSSCSFSPSTPGNCTSRNSPIIQLMFFNSLPHQFSHSFKRNAPLPGEKRGFEKCFFCNTVLISP